MYDDICLMCNCRCLDGFCIGCVVMYCFILWCIVVGCSMMVSMLFVIISRCFMF